MVVIKILTIELAQCCRQGQVRLESNLLYSLQVWPPTARETTIGTDECICQQNTCGKKIYDRYNHGYRLCSAISLLAITDLIKFTIILNYYKREIDCFERLFIFDILRHCASRSLTANY